MRYSVMAGGKRLRPILVLLGARAGGGREEDVVGVACAVEFVHTYSLIHDDLPAMDDDYRRGRLSCHKEFGEATAILAGDALHTLAFETIAACAPDAARVPDMVGLLCRAAGTRGMVGGQVDDLASEGAPPDVDAVRSIHERKTGALLNASLRLGAVAVGADPATLERLDRFGRGLGLAFQIVDDVLDEEGDASHLGKTPGKDRRTGKLTYPAAVGIDASRREARSLVTGGEASLEGLPGAGLLRGLAQLVLERRG
jgi:geranylgeranyl diphosphate synthase type II